MAIVMYKSLHAVYPDVVCLDRLWIHTVKKKNQLFKEVYVQYLINLLGPVLDNRIEDKYLCLLVIFDPLFSLKPHCTSYSYMYLRPLYSKQCLIGACWSPMSLFFLC